MAAVRLPFEVMSGGLEKLLKLFGVNFSLWGKGDARTFADYYKELVSGESILGIDSHGLYRKLRIVKMLIEDPEKGVLLEDYQILTDGRRRDRQQSPGGKIGAHETLEEALAREMDEELHLGKNDFTAEFVETHGDRRDSKSYPGLDTFYEVFTVRVTLAPHVRIDDGYNTLDKEDGKQLFFRWKKD